MNRSKLGSHVLWIECLHLCETILTLLETELASVPSQFPERPTCTSAPSAVILCVHGHLQHLPRCLARGTVLSKHQPAAGRNATQGKHPRPRPQELMTAVGQKLCLELIRMWFGVGGLQEKCQRTSIHEAAGQPLATTQRVCAYCFEKMFVMHGKVGESRLRVCIA